MIARIENIIANKTAKSMVLFILTLAVFEIIYLLIDDSDAIVMFATTTAHFTGLLLSLLGEVVRVDGIFLHSPLLNMRIVSECTAITPTMVFIAAVIAFPSPKLTKLKGILLGIVGLYLINLIRVISLYYIGIHIPDQMEFAHLVMWQTFMVLIAIGLWALWASGKLNFVIQKFQSSKIALILMWAIIGFAIWYFIADSYAMFLGGLVWEYFPQNVNLLVKDHNLSIVLIPENINLLVKDGNFTINTINNTPLRHLNFVNHNFGFGLIIIAAVILGTYKRPWKFRLISLASAWLFLLFTQASLLLMGAYSYKLAFSDAKIGLGFSIFVEVVHIIVIVLPIMLSVLWLMIPFQSRRLRNKEL